MSRAASIIFSVGSTRTRRRSSSSATRRAYPARSRRSTTPVTAPELSAAPAAMSPADRRPCCSSRSSTRASVRLTPMSRDASSSSASTDRWYSRKARVISAASSSRVRAAPLLLDVILSRELNYSHHEILATGEILDDARDRRQGARQDLSGRRPRARRTRPRGRVRDRLRPARAQRRGQVDDGADPHHAGPRRRGPRDRRGPGRGGRRRRGARGDRRRRPALGRRHRRHGPREPRAPRPPARAARRRRARRRAARALRARGCRRPARQDVVGGHVPPARPGDGPDPSTPGPVPRRAHDGPRSRGARPAVGRDRRAGPRRGPEHPAYHPLPRGGRRARRPPGDRRRGPRRRRGHAGGAQERAAGRHRARRARRRRDERPRDRGRRGAAQRGPRRGQHRRFGAARPRARRRARRPGGPRRARVRRRAGRLRHRRPPVARRRLPAPHRPRLRHREPGMTAALEQSLAISARQLRALVRQPIYVAVTLVQPVIWLLLFGALFKRVVDLPGFRSDSYVDFLTPGIVIMSALFSSGWNGMGMLNDLQRGVLDRFLTTPVRRGPLIAGPLLQAVAIALIQSVVIVGLAAIVGASFPGGAAGIAVLLVVAGLLAAAMAGLSNGLALITRQEESLVGTVQLLVLPLTFLSTAFMAPALLPGWIGDVAKANPINWAIEAGRSALAADPDWGLILPRLGALLALAMLSGWFATRAFRAYQRAL